MGVNFSNATDIATLNECCSARLKELDKAFKACIKGGVQSAAEKINEKIRAVKAIAQALNDE